VVAQRSLCEAEPAAEVGYANGRQTHARGLHPPAAIGRQRRGTGGETLFRELEGEKVGAPSKQKMHSFSLFSFSDSVSSLSNFPEVKAGWCGGAPRRPMAHNAALTLFVDMSLSNGGKLLSYCIASGLVCWWGVWSRGSESRPQTNKQQQNKASYRVHRARQENSACENKLASGA
jgi:hypothetical protein